MKQSPFPLYVFKLAWPVILSNITIPLLGIVDLTVIGRYHQQYDLAAIAVGSIFFDALLGLMNFLRMSTTGLVAQNPKDSELLPRAFICALGLAIILLLIKPILWQLCFLLANHSLTLKLSLFNYFDLRYWAIPATLINYVLIGFCFGQRNTRLPLALLLLNNVLAISLDIFFVYHLEMATRGLALANLIAQWLSMLLGFYFIFRKYKELFRFRISIVKNTQKLIKFLKINKDIFLRTTCLMSTLAYFTYIGSQLGSHVVAANGLLISLLMLMSYFMDGFAIVCEILIGNAIGKKDQIAFKQAVIDCGSWSLLIALLFCLNWWGIGAKILQYMTDIKPIYTLANYYLPWLYGLPLVAFLSYLMDGIYIGATWTKELRNTMMFATLAVFFPSTLLFSSLANNGLWLSYTLFLAARGFSLLLDLRKKVQNQILQ